MLAITHKAGLATLFMIYRVLYWVAMVFVGCDVLLS